MSARLADVGAPSQIGHFLRMEAALGGFASRLLVCAGRPFGPQMPQDDKYVRGEPRQCFRNAFVLAQENHELTYCEGRAFATVPIPVEHAWCVTRDGRVVDNTWPDGGEYFGIAFSTPFLLSWIQRTGVYGVLGTHFPEVLLSADPREFLADARPGVPEATRALCDEMLGKLKNIEPAAAPRRTRRP